MKIYYAHGMALYNTKQEKRDIETLKRLGFTVVNPNAAAHDKGAKLYGMEYFKRFAVSCDAIAFRAFPDGSIPGGVSLEVNWFIEKKKPVIELPNFHLRRRLNREETIAYIREVGVW